MTSKLPVNIRQAKQEDAKAIVGVHYNAVHTTAAVDYEVSILDEWSSTSAERINKLARQIKDNPENTTMLVAELNGKIVGFCEVVPALEELRAVYVDPKASRQGVGNALLKSLEDVARKNNCKRLWLDSSLTAVPFYTAHGFINDGLGEHVLGSGQKMLCVKMHKDLSNLSIQ